MNLDNHKQALGYLNKQNKLIIGISVWTHNSKRMRFKAYFDDIQHVFGPHMAALWNSKKPAKFVDIYGNRHKFDFAKLRIFKFDTATFEMKEGEENRK